MIGIPCMFRFHDSPKRPVSAAFHIFRTVLMIPRAETGSLRVC